MNETMKPMPKRAPMERIVELEEALGRAKEALAREIQARDEFRQKWEEARRNATLAENRLADADRKTQGLEDSYTALNLECRASQTEVRVLREIVNRLLPAKVES